MKGNRLGGSKGFVGLIGVALALVGVWGSWVPHRVAALTLSGWDLAEFVRFVPGALVPHELFYLPVWCAGVALVNLQICRFVGVARQWRAKAMGSRVTRAMPERIAAAVRRGVEPKRTRTTWRPAGTSKVMRPWGTLGLTGML